MTPKSRSLLALILFVPLAAILLTTFACLPAPVGDPEAAKIDPVLTGLYKVADTNLVTIHPWDSHTYFVQYLAIENKDGKENSTRMCFKGWLTTLGTATFLTLEPMDNFALEQQPAGEKVVFYLAFRVDKNPTGFTALMVDGDSPLVKGLKTRPEIEAAIKANLDNKALYEKDPLPARKLGKEDEKFIEPFIEKFHITPLKT